MSTPASVGVFGGSGLYTFLDDVETVSVDTPYGPPSGELHVGTLHGRSVTFLARHGARHEYLPHRINYRANMWAMRELGVTHVLGPFACGSLQPDIHPGDFVVVDQLVDRTWGRSDTYYDVDGEPPTHVSFADPYCAATRQIVLDAARELGARVHDGGTVVVVNGPRFSTHAESVSYREQGWACINMTQYPEAYLARELGLCYAGVALVTDYDTGVADLPGAEPVTQQQVFEFFDANVARIRDVLFTAIGRLDTDCTYAGTTGPRSVH